MRHQGLVIVFAFSLSLLASGLAVAADDSKVKDSMNRAGSGVSETAKGAGTTVTEGAKYSGERVKEAGQSAEAPAKSAWGSFTGFFTNLFSK